MWYFLFGLVLLLKLEDSVLFVKGIVYLQGSMYIVIGLVEELGVFFGVIIRVIWGGFKELVYFFFKVLYMVVVVQYLVVCFEIMVIVDCYKVQVFKQVFVVGSLFGYGVMCNRLVRVLMDCCQLYSLKVDDGFVLEVFLFQLQVGMVLGLVMGQGDLIKLLISLVLQVGGLDLVEVFDGVVFFVQLVLEQYFCRLIVVRFYIQFVVGLLFDECWVVVKCFGYFGNDMDDVVLVYLIVIVVVFVGIMVFLVAIFVELFDFWVFFLQLGGWGSGRSVEDDGDVMFMQFVYDVVQLFEVIFFFFGFYFGLGEFSYMDYVYGKFFYVVDVF